MTRSVAICVATCRRPAGLRRLLASLGAIRVPRGHELEVRVVDNAPDGRAATEVRIARAAMPFPIRFGVERAPNVAAARNRAIAMGHADLVAFVDDDERVTPGWLEALVRTLDAGDADAAFGPVLRRLPPDAPAWVRRAGVFDAELPTALLDWRAGRTGNALVRGRWFYAEGLRFDPAFGRSGGEDVHFFARLARRGAKLVGTPAAVAVEDVEPHRLRLGWHLARRFRAGKALHRVERDGPGDGRPPLARLIGRPARAGLRLLTGIKPLAAGDLRPAVAALLDVALAAGGAAGMLGLADAHGASPFGGRVGS